jgi:hypothetical protein
MIQQKKKSDCPDAELQAGTFAEYTKNYIIKATLSVIPAEAGIQ